MEKRYSCYVDAAQAGYTVKQVMTHRWKLGTGQIKKAKFRENGILVNGQQVTVRYVLKEGDVLEVLLEEKTQGSAHLIPVKGTLQIVYEDEDILIVEKPAGIVCHPSAGHYCDSMANLLVGYFTAKGEGYIVRLAGRLDKGTSGLLLYAKHAPALTELERQRVDGRMKKTYYAILNGCPDIQEADIEMPLGPDGTVPMKQRVYKVGEMGGAYAKSHYKIIGKTQDGSFSLAELCIETGRTHQIRTHMSWLGFPLVGDALYGGELKGDGELNDTAVKTGVGKGFGPMTEEIAEKTVVLTRPALHAYKLAFEHPVTGKQMEFVSEMPQDMRDFQAAQCLLSCYKFTGTL